MANRQVFPRNEVAHLWAHRAQDSARVAGGNFYFTGGTLYSYGSHFVCGHLMPEAYNVEAAPLVLVNAGNYSMTTSRHMCAMYRALPSYFTKYHVAGLNDGMVRSIGRDGAREVIAAILGSMRDRLADAATTTRVRHATRAASLSAAATHASMARHLATVDAGRKDLSKELRAKAREVLRALPSVDDFQIDGADRDGIVALAKRANREKARADYAEKIERFRVKAGRVAEYASDTRDSMYAAHWRQEARDAINLFDHYVKRDAEIGDVRISKSDKALRDAMTAALPILEKREAESERAQNVADWISRVAAMDGEWNNIRSADHYLSGMRELAERLSALDSDAEKAERAATFARLADKVKSFKAATAVEHCGRSLEIAQSYIPGAHWLDAQTYVKEARRIAENNASDADKPALIAQCDELQTAIDAALAERRERETSEWRKGSRRSIGRELCDSGALLRVRGETIETSWGATVPLAVAPIVWRLVSAARNAGAAQSWAHGTGPRLGAFHLDSVGENGDIVAGCHVIQFGELARLACELGYTAERAA